jgi:hypothetical protein
MKHFYFFLGLMTSVLWSADATTDDIVSYTTFWIAFDAATVQDEFQYIHVDVTLDGKSVTQEMKYMATAEPYLVTCPENGQQFEASRVRYTLILPPLSSGAHDILWSYTITTDPNDGAFNDSRGMPSEHNIRLTIEI